MRTPLLAVAVVLVAGSSAFALETLIPNGSFEIDGNAGGFTQTITNWTPSFTPTQAANAIPVNQYSGLFTTYGKWFPAAVPNGVQFAMIDNLGYATSQLQSSIFAVTDRRLEFRYAYMTNHPFDASTRDQFLVRVDFFNNAGGVGPAINTTGDLLVADRGQFDDTATGFSPWSSLANSAAQTFNNSVGGTFNHFFVNLDLGNTFGQFARVTFIINNNNVTVNQSEGQGVSGALIDNVLVTPEPGTLGLFLAGAASLSGLAWRRRRAAAKKPATQS